jgi:hypothetical protein
MKYYFYLIYNYKKMEINIMGYKMRLELIILSMLIGGFIGMNMFCSCMGGVKETFTLLGAELDYQMGDGVKSSWEKKTSTEDYSSGIYQSLENNTGGAVPLPDSEMIMFAENKYAPECCPSVYSNSSGCVCATPEQMKYLNQRGGNRTLTSEY